MPRYEYRCPQGHIVEEVRSMDDRDLLAACYCGADASVIFSLPNPSNIAVPMNFQAKHGCPTWSDFHDRTEKELAKDPRIERYQVAASKPGMGNTISQPTPEKKRKVVAARGKYPSGAV